MPIECIDPTSGALIKRYQELPPEAVQTAIDAAGQAQRAWRRSTFAERARVLEKAAGLMRERAGIYAQLMAQEMGKIVREGRAEAEKCAWVCDYYADNAERFLAPEIIETDAKKSYVACNPLGVVLAVMPWNFPFWQVFRFAAPALMAGNAGLLKHASNVPGCALAIEEVWHDAGLPDHLFTTLLIGSGQVEAVLEHPVVKAATLTGSTPAGQAVAATAGRVLKKTVLELGGSDPYVILEDADLERTVEACVIAKCINAGQSCIAAKRFVVVKAVRDEFEQRFVEALATKRWGDPNDPATDLGPMARHDLRDELHDQVVRSVAAGARCLLGGEVPDDRGAYYPATVLTDVAAGCPAYEEELFGPVASIVPVVDEEEAIRVANDSVFGLGAAVFTRDRARGERIAAEELEAGSCFVNTFVRSDPRLPFGGVKTSGHGRELSHHGIKEFVNLKTVHVG